jgi:general nucleoside transport system permease protein
MSEQPPRPDEEPVPPRTPDEIDAELEAAKERDRQTATVRVDAGVGERFVRAVTGVNVRITILAIVSALVIGALFIALSEDQALRTLGYLTSRPTDYFSAAWDAIRDAYVALFRGAFVGSRSLSETVTASIPLILTGLAVALPFRAGLFNIGAQGQVIAGGLVGGWVGFTLTGLPLIVHLPLAILAGFIGGALYGFIPGLLKARTGAHEVISTIMLNNIAILVMEYLLTTSFRAPGRTDPISKSIPTTAQLPRFDSSLRVHTGIILALLVAVLIFYLVERSTFGFELNAIGLNPNAATSAGMSVNRVTILALTLAGAMAGLAGANQVLGVQYRVTSGFSESLGFDGITVALLGRGGVGGTVAAGFLFGALRAGGRTMQAQSGTSLDLVTVIQALVIVFIAAPALVRALFRIRTEAASSIEVAKGWS